MESNTCDINHLDADVLLPPRKRLLAGLKRQNSDLNPQTPTSYCNVGSEFDNRVNNLMKSRLSNPNLSNEEIVEASRLAAIEAAKAAQAARANAEEKAAKAVKAVAAAKSALELVATVSEEIDNGEKYLKKNKMKKHVQVQALYNKPRGTQTWKTDEELARKLHRAINSSPRILKNTSTSDSKSHKHKKLKRSSSFEKTGVNNGGTVHVNQPSISNGNGIAGGMDRDGSVQDGVTRVDLNIPKFNKADGRKMESREKLKRSKSDILIKENGEPDTVHLRMKVGEDDNSGLGQKRGKIKQKKLPLSICSIRDLGNPKEDLKSKSLSSTDNNRNKVNEPNGTSKSMFSVGPSSESVMPVERTSIWKCQAFKAPACVKQNKVMQS
ncbi:hypothetical protein ACH5RR_013541 [Cinchona calisaya]|uniref:Uncharacterized protein n=1 Tax=Cinchona calisaya TaxID=153742 RepID=A0ABD3A1Q4_9GENT